MFSFSYVWPYMGLGAALLFALLLCTDALRSDLTVSRWRDLVWLAWLGMLAYLIHQFEEHGIDMQGATYAFRGEMCRNMGQPDAQTCPIPFSFVNAVNITCVWVFGPVTALLGRRWPGFALAFFAIPFVNTLIHLIPVVTQGAYNAGLLTALVFFVPLSLWAFHVALSRYRLGWRAVIATIAAGIVFHAIMIGSLPRLPRRRHRRVRARRDPGDQSGPHPPHRGCISGVGERCRHPDRHVQKHLREGLGQRVGLERGHAAAAQRLAQQEVEAVDAGQPPARHLALDAMGEVLRHRLLRHLGIEDRLVLRPAREDADIGVVALVAGAAIGQRHQRHGLGRRVRAGGRQRRCGRRLDRQVRRCEAAALGARAPS